MRNLMKYYEIAVNKCLDQDIPIVEPQEVKVNNRYKQRWGCCKGRTVNGKWIPRVIDINPVLLDERNSEVGLIETLIHELIHTAPGCQNHGAKWKAYVAKINKAYGYTIETRNSDDDKGISNECKAERMAAREAKRKYELTCTRCGAVIKYARPCKTWMYYKIYRCGACHGELKQTGEYRTYTVNHFLGMKGA